MRSTLGFLSFFAFGVLTIGILTVVGSGGGQDGALAELRGLYGGGGEVQLGSLLIGLVLGVMLSALARVSWTELPYRFCAWLLSYRRIVFRLTLATAFLGVLIFY